MAARTDGVERNWEITWLSTCSV